MKRILLLCLIASAFSANAQTKTELQKHFEGYYNQMKHQGDIQGIINALTHLEVMAPSQARKDTLAYIYASEGRHMEALNTIGIDVSDANSDLNTEVKAIALKALNQPLKALEHYEVLFKKIPNPFLAYELAELKIMVKDLAGATSNIDYGLANAKDDMKRTFYESQPPYQASLKASFMYQKALVKLNENPEANIATAITLLDEALAIDPNFKLAQLSKDALKSRLEQQKQN